jgi:hydrophobic/amphiphilic exporter-1 (mainly G- bacteria), HAE1 family
MNWIDEVLRRPVSVGVATVAACALGLFSLAKLPLALLPSIERPRLVIVAKAQASSRDEMLHDVTGPIERRLASVPGITSIESETTDGESRIELGSAWQTDPDRLRIDVARRIEGAPTAALDDLAIDVAGSDDSPVIEVAVMGGSGAARTRIAERVVLPELARIAGAGKIEVLGATPLRVTVQPNAAALMARNLTALDVEERLRTAGTAIAAGRVRDGASMRPLVVAQPLRSVEDVRALRVRDVALGEIADVELREVPDGTMFLSGPPASSPAGTRASRSRQRRDAAVPAAGTAAVQTATEGVLLRVYRAPGANAVALASGVKARVEELSGRVANVQIAVVSDRSLEVKRALIELALAALAGVLLGTFVLRYMLGVWRPTLALAIVVPAALLVSFSAFYFAGIQLDVISLAGLALATGLLVDNSIVVLESIESARAAGTGDPVASGTKQIVRAVVASSITLMIVFVPLLYLRGLARALFGEQAIAVVATVAASLVLSLTLTPVLARRDARPTRPRSPGLDGYLRLLDRALAKPARTIAIAAVLVAVALALGVLLPRELFARGGVHRVVVDAQLPPDLDPVAARALAMKLWRAVPDPRSLTLQQGRITMELDRAPRAVEAAGVRAVIREKGSAFIEAVSGEADRIELVASGASEAEAEQLARRVTEEMKRAGLEPLDARVVRGRAAMLLHWNETVAADRRGNEQQVRAALGGADVGQNDIARAEPAIRVLPTTPPELGVVPVRTGERVVPLAALAGARLAERTPVIQHDEGRPSRRLLFAGSRPPALEARGTERIRVAGQARELADAFGQMGLAIVLAVILLYLTVAAFYESLALPLAVLAALPFAGAGAIVALLATGQSLNVMSLIGLVFLAGVVVNHTVVLIDRAEQLRREGVPAIDAVRRAAADRYRPVMMTTLTAILGMLPLAILGGPGVELRRAVAVAITGGLITATIGTLIVVPLLLLVVRRAPGHA